MSLFFIRLIVFTALSFCLLTFYSFLITLVPAEYLSFVLSIITGLAVSIGYLIYEG